ncbi:copper chaperone PCu(A)C [Luteibacter yeojuensis]|uniref:Copper chaperone PCu(A)C n=1 Tax=Luteibacter yeojuensis TaxID=345309 RepID=A0A0F3L0A9_9GAMM|nr:copper chaperone PCu(A)C [Luteibacter yeojuensis]KJV36975.1 hypothetical protein VI08_01920 [Luteibacter yeojuensis]
MKIRWMGVVTVGLGLAAGAASATQADHVQVSQGWIRLLPGSLPAGGYATLRNDGSEVATLTELSSPRYGDVMLHESDTSGGMGRMAMVDRLPIPPAGSVALSPGGYHVMLSDAPKPIAVGERVPIRLTFEDGSHLDASFVVRPANANSATD